MRAERDLAVGNVAEPQHRSDRASHRAPAAPCALTERQFNVLRALDDEAWLTPMFVGGSNGSHHSATLAWLARHSLAERKKSCWCGPGSRIDAAIRARGGIPRWPWCRCKGSCRYRRTPRGSEIVAEEAR